MATSFGAAHAQPSSTPLLSQSDFLDEARLPKNLFKIHKKQQELLDKTDSWIQYLIRQPKPRVNLPPEVLENLRNLHRRQAEFANNHVLDDPPNSVVSVKNDTGDNDDGQPPGTDTSYPGSDKLDDEIEDDEAGTPFSWPPSPAHNGVFAEQEKFMSQSPSAQETYGSTTQQPFLSQVPPRSPLQATLDASAVQREAVFNDFPSSSLGADAELEIVAPAALTTEQSALAKPAELNPTPPSAQIQVPCTFENDSSIPEKQPKEAVVPPCRELASLQKVQERVRQKKAAAAADIPDSQSSVDSTSSVIPATNLERWQRSPVKSLRTQPFKSTVKETPYIDRRTSMGPPRRRMPSFGDDATVVFDKAILHDKTPEYHPVSPRLEFSSPIASPNKMQSPQVGADVLQAPFMQYCLAYPNYTGSVGDFVSACMCIQKRRLAPYQYDDFIRAWREGYLAHVQEAIEASEEPLVAADWYMEQAEDFPHAYQASVVTKTNLDAVLRAYPEEVEARSESRGEEGAHMGCSVSNGPLQEAREKALELTIQRSIEPGNRESDTKELPPQRETMSLDYAIGHGTAEQTATFARPLSVDGEEPIPARPLSRLDTSVKTRKRCADDDGSEIALQRVPSVSAASSEGSTGSCQSAIPRNRMSSASKPPKSAGPSMKKKKGKGPIEYDAQDFKKFLGKQPQEPKRMSDQISVGSSAPVRATPVSGQKRQKS